MKRLILTLAFNLFAMAFDILMVMVAAQRRVDWSRPLVDVGFTNLPELPRTSILFTAPDFMVMTLLVLTLLRCLLHPERKKCLRRLFMVGGIISIMRGLSITMTILPEPSPLCANYHVPRHEIIFVALYHKLLEFLQGTSPLDCGGCFFSGHSATVATCSMVWIQFTDNRIIHALVWMWSLAAVVIMVWVRFHYTLDCVYGVLIAVTVWNYYNSCATNPNLTQFWAWRWLEASDPPSPVGPTLVERGWERFVIVTPFPPHWRTFLLRSQKQRKEREAESKSLFVEEVKIEPVPYQEV
eukprot:TRINITY_DN3442_c0_g1_i1.p1 TRINITY_DN3442_c0_g1~~TRINITY_DN3442_c0_g1_i1.p1  ORF type:complete len:297 (-),score=38.67 TRINITY_DN3442_c0_g1_i1:211-1101(-)